LVAEARKRNGVAIQPIHYFLENACRTNLIAKRGSKTIATGL
jgi:hypothetical protein